MASQQPITGVIGACLTPFERDGRVNFEALGREIDFLAADCDAISVAAVEAAEYSMLAPPERRELIREGIAMVGGRVPVIAGASSPSPRGVLELAEFAAAHGADLVQVLMPLRPWGGQPSTAELVRYFEEIATRSPLPIVAYHNPACGADPSIDAYIALARIPRVLYFKESSRDITKIGRIIAQMAAIGRGGYFTTMQPLLITLLLGGAGATMPPPGTRIAAQVVRAFRAGDLARAAAWARSFMVFPGAWPAYALPPVMKAAMRHFGIDLGDPAHPYAPVAAEHDKQIGEYLRRLGVLEANLPLLPNVEEAISAVYGAHKEN